MKQARGQARRNAPSTAALPNGHTGYFAEVRRQMIDNKPLRNALEEAAGRRAIFMPDPGNTGDGFIALGTFHYLDSIGYSPPVGSTGDPRDLEEHDLLILGGGGSLIEGFYGEPFDVVEKHLRRGGELILLPSTVLGHEAFFERYAKQVTLFAREQRTFDHLSKIAGLENRVHPCHDMVFGLDPAFYEDHRTRAGDGVLQAFRSDQEGMPGLADVGDGDIQIVFNGHIWHDRSLCERVVTLYAGYVSAFARVETDRLHLALLSAMLDRDTLMFPNNYHKNRSIYEFSLAGAPNINFFGEEDGPPMQALSPVNLAGPDSKELTRRQFQWEAFREKSAYLEKEVQRLKGELGQMEATKAEWWDPEIKRLGEALEQRDRDLGSTQARLSETSSELERLSNEGRRVAADLTRAQAENARLAGLASELEQRDRDVARLSAYIQELEGAKSTYFVPELERLTRLAQEREQRLDAALAQAEARRVETAVAAAELAESRKALDAARLETERLERALSEASAARQEAAAGLQSLQLRVEQELEPGLAASRAEADAAHAEIARMIEAFQKAAASEREAQDRLTALQARVDGELEPQLAASRDELGATRSEADRLRKAAFDAAANEAVTAARLEELQLRVRRELEPGLATAYAERDAALSETERVRRIGQHARRSLIDAEDRMALSREAERDARARALQLQTLVDEWFRPQLENAQDDVASAQSRQAAAEEALRKERARAEDDRGELEELRSSLRAAALDRAASEDALERVSAEKNLIEFELVIAREKLSEAAAVEGQREQALVLREAEAKEIRSELDAIRRSASYRMIQKYRDVHAAPLIGGPLRLIRRLAGRPAGAGGR